MSQDVKHQEPGLSGRLKKYAGTSILLGLAMLIMGALAIALPLVAAMSVAIILGLVLVIAGPLGDRLLTQLEEGKNVPAALPVTKTVMTALFERVDQDKGPGRAEPWLSTTKPPRHR